MVTTVTQEVVDDIIAWIIDSRPGKKKFTLAINSLGGDPVAVLYFASFLTTLPASVKIEGVAFGVCGSAALALLQCCTNRISLKHCGFFIHHLQHRFEVNCQEPDAERYQAELALSRTIEEEIVALQSDRVGILPFVWMKLADESEKMPGKGILPEQALTIGLIDSIEKRFAIF